MHFAQDDHRVQVQRSGRPMATTVSVHISTSKERYKDAESAADDCMGWFREVDLRLSRFREESELCALNRSGGRWFAASSLLYAAVTVALQSARASSGLFDPTLLPQLEALGYDRDFSLIAQRETETAGCNRLAPTPVVAPQQWRGIELDPSGRRIRLPEGVRLDLGGIAKGWSADVALHRFGLPFDGALINVGGDLRAHGGPAAGENWSIGIRDPRIELSRPLDPPHVPGAMAMPAPAESTTAYIALLGLSRGGLATSGAVRRWWLRGGKPQHHLLNPETGLPVELWIDAHDAPAGNAGSLPLVATATALAPTAARAEVAAKVALLRGYPRALREVEAAWGQPIHLGRGTSVSADTAVALVLTFGTGEVATSANLEAYLATWGTQAATLTMEAYFSP